MASTKPLLLLLLFFSCADLSQALLDVVFLIDTTASLGTAGLTDLQNSITPVMDNIVANVDSDTRFGLASFEDYGQCGSFGSGNDNPYQRLVDMTSSRLSIQTAMDGVVLGLGGNTAESSLAAVFQALTGAGQSFGQTGTIPANLNFSFRSNAQKIILMYSDAPFGDPAVITAYPGPTFDAVIAELTSSTVDPPYRFVGVAKATVPQTTTDMTRLASATSSIATQEFDCYTGKTVASGATLVCNDVQGAARIQEAFVNMITEAYNIDAVPELVCAGISTIACSLGATLAALLACA